MGISSTNSCSFVNPLPCQNNQPSLCHFIAPHQVAKIKAANLEQFKEQQEIIIDHHKKSHKIRKLRKNHLKIAAFEKQQGIQAVVKESVAFDPDSKVSRLIKIYDLKHLTKLPGSIAKTSRIFSSDKTVNNAYNGSKLTYLFYGKVLGRDSIDGRGMLLNSSVHYDKNYNNAFWDGKQMIYGDGDQKIFGDFTEDLDVMSHELTHGITQYTAALAYEGQSGALNEATSDIMASVVKQWANRQEVNQANWLIGDVCLLGEGALRSLKNPGQAYKNHPILGDDPQPASMDQYVKTEEDDGGVHLNSGIPNHSFYLAAEKIGGTSEKIGKIWYATLCSNKVTPTCDFKTFAQINIAIAGELYGKESLEQKAIRYGWAATKVLL